MPRFKISKPVLIGLLILTAAFLFYFPSYSRYRELKIEAEKLEAQLQVMQEQIQALQKEKQLMRNDQNYLESVIRKELGLVEPGEVVYEFEKKPSTKALANSLQPKAPRRIAPITSKSDKTTS